MVPVPTVTSPASATPGEIWVKRLIAQSWSIRALVLIIQPSLIRVSILTHALPTISIPLPNSTLLCIEAVGEIKFTTSKPKFSNSVWIVDLIWLLPIKQD